MFSIGEFSKTCGLSVKTLRFYHEKGLLVPAHVDPHSGYRYYDANNLEKAGVIRLLREFEFPLEDIETILAECGEDQDAIEHLQRHKKSLTNKLQHYQDLVEKLDQVVSYKLEDREVLKMQKLSYEIEERTIEPLLVAGIRMRGKYSDSGQGFSQLGKKMGRYMMGKPLCLYYDGEYREDDADFEPCFPLRKEVSSDDFDIRTLPAINCITLVHQGPYDSLGQSYARLFEYVKQKNLELQLPSREVYLKGPGMIFKGNPKKYLTEIQLPIKT